MGVWLFMDGSLLDLFGFVEEEESGTALTGFIYMLLVLGGLLFFSGFLGCLGAMCINSYLLSFVSTNNTNGIKGKIGIALSIAIVNVCLTVIVCQ